ESVPRQSAIDHRHQAPSEARRGRSAAAVLLLALAVAVVPGSAQVTNYLDLKVMNGANIARMNEPVSFGVPIGSENQVYDAGWVQILDPPNQPVARQFTVLSRWGGDRNDLTKPIRWMLVSFNANVPPNATAIYHVATGATVPA